MKTRRQTGKEDTEGTVKAGRERKEKRSSGARQRKEGSDWKRFSDMSPPFKSYSMTNKLPLSHPPSHTRLTANWLPWWGGLPIATGGGVVPWDWQWRQLASDCLSVCPSPCVRLGLWVHSWSDRSVRLCVCCRLSLKSKVWGWSPHICWNHKLAG